jgi:chaperone modulatory protein CbpM
MKRCATNDAWADARLSLDQASDMPLRIFFVAEAMIRDLKSDLGVNDESVGVILNLVDQVHGLRRVLAEVLRSVRSRT